MGILDKLKFWKKKSPLEELEESVDKEPFKEDIEKHEFGTEKHLFGETTTSFHEEEEEPRFASPVQPGFHEPPQPQGFSPYLQKDIQLMLSKLETIQARLENMDRRMQVIEENIQPKTEKKKAEWY